MYPHERRVERMDVRESPKFLAAGSTPASPAKSHHLDCCPEWPCPDCKDCICVEYERCCCQCFVCNPEIKTK
jgi:hypothetical protein